MLLALTYGKCLLIFCFLASFAEEGKISYALVAFTNFELKIIIFFLKPQPPVYYQNIFKISPNVVIKRSVTYFLLGARGRSSWKAEETKIAFEVDRSLTFSKFAKKCAVCMLANQMLNEIMLVSRSQDCELKISKKVH